MAGGRAGYLEPKRGLSRKEIPGTSARQANPARIRAPGAAQAGPARWNTTPGSGPVAGECDARIPGQPRPDPGRTGPGLPPPGREAAARPSPGRWTGPIILNVIQCADDP